ncbi:Wzz/FepE/Etk N-terminal domain-containing protein [Pseudoalteromonas tunicata]|uniref:OtnB protein n=1 Tax=Pseudoalteromonas tunicata D2 TaxID=87626 RepID=A4C8G6_9GAMM|nr:Wzz/FepE/Etk N-terminal domain-containing protein [Pseudoalteromonas tunicata]ATC93385.1 hypothetical protein PTUN_a0618 [Pseudoalteromonas tunicata]AXT32430.1 LPS O-antigen length regulator [Pseudoalteromonas tunicata]EAR28881.1 OtnB protein [Pseudoalteromonas tunicata D2]
MQSVANKLNDEIELTQLISALWQGKILIVGLVILCSACSVFYALSLPNIYKSTVLLTAADESQNSGMSKLNSQFGGLAAMAGVKLGSSGVDKSALALEIIKSHAFIAEFIDKNNLKPLIMAADNWDLGTNKVSYKPSVYNAESKVWVREAKIPRLPEPSSQEVHEKFIKEHLSINSDKKSNLVSISIFHVSPYVAKDIADKLVVAINAKIKKDDIDEANKSIAYLTSALGQTAVADMQKIFYELIEQQEQTKMLANARDQYVFKVIDPAVVAELKDSPKRAIICIFGSVLGFLLGCGFVLIRYFLKKS